MDVSSLVKQFERIIGYFLMAMMGIVLILATLDIGWLIIKDIFTPPLLILDVNKLLYLFGKFLLVLIGLELLETISIFHKDRIVSAEIILVVALIAISRKVIILDESKLSNLTFFDIGVLVLTLAVAYFMLKLGQKNNVAHGTQKTNLSDE